MIRALYMVCIALNLIYLATLIGAVALLVRG